MLKKSVTSVITVVTKNNLSVEVENFIIAATEGCTQKDEKNILAEFVQKAAGRRTAGGWSATPKNRPGHCSLEFVNVSEILKGKLVTEAMNYYKGGVTMEET